MISRRIFLGGAAGAAAVGTGAWATLLRDSVESSTPARPVSTTTAAKTTSTVIPTTTVAETVGTTSGRVPVTERVLVVLEMAGGNDALNTVVPLAGDAGRYHDLRPTIALSDAALAPLDPNWGLHPALSPLGPFWDEGAMAAVAGVGMPEQSRSHFKAMDTWWSGVPGAPSRTGWLGRWLDASLDAERNGIDDPLRAIALGGGSPALVGLETMATAIRNPATFQLLTFPSTDADALVDAFLATAAPLSADATLAAAQTAIPGTLDAVALLATASGNDDTGNVFGGGPPGAETSAVELLQTAARIIELDVGTRVITVGVSGFDTHADQLDRHDQLLADVGAGLEGFFAALAASGDLDRVMVVTTSEFGRRGAENGSGGTDHGNGGLQFLFGPSVSGGVVHGGYDLASLRDGDVASVIDTRSVYQATLEWLGGPGAAEGIFDDPPPVLAI